MANLADYQFQEIVRTLDATLWEFNSDQGHLGQNAMKIIEFIGTFALSTLSPELRTIVEEGIVEAKTKPGQNVRGIVKKILAYPRPSGVFPPWIEHDVAFELSFRFEFQMVNGKVYAVCENQAFIRTLFDEVKRMRPDLITPDLEMNFEAAHITVVNSDIVAKVGLDLVTKLVADWDITFEVKTGKVKETFSEDWSRFGRCLVIETKSRMLDAFLWVFNEQFGQTVKVSPHVTFAIQSRNLLTGGGPHFSKEKK